MGYQEKLRVRTVVEGPGSTRSVGDQREDIIVNELKDTSGIESDFKIRKTNKWTNA